MENKEELEKARLELVSKINEYVKLGGTIYTSIEEEFEGELVTSSYYFHKAVLSNSNIYLTDKSSRIC